MTECDIIMMIRDGVYLLTRCSSGGYISDVGNTLLTHYTNDKDILQLITIGQFSPLCDDVVTTRLDNLCDDYDHGYPVVLDDVDSLEWKYYTRNPDPVSDGASEHRYLWKNNEWLYTTFDDNGYLPWVKLVDAKVDPKYNVFL